MSEFRCRACGAQLDAESVSFHLNMKEASDGLTLRDKLAECVPEISINEESKDAICISCFALLTSAYNFRKMCLKTDETFCQNEEAKQTVPDDNDEESKLMKIMGSITTSGYEVSISLLPQQVINSARNGNSIYVCDRCKSLFLCRENYAAHVCEGAERCGKCLQCNVSFRSNVIFEMHMKFMHSRKYGIYRLKHADERNRLASTENANVATEKQAVNVKTPSTVCSKINLESTTIHHSNLSKTITKNMKKVSVTHLSGTNNKRNGNKLKSKIKKHICIFCVKCFKTSFHLQRHLSVHRKYCYRCLRCKKFCVNRDHNGIRRECNSVDFAPPTFTNTRCPFCFKHYPTMLDFKEHLSDYGHFRKFCFTCHVNFKTIWEMTLHHIANNCASTQFLTGFLTKESDLSCPICKKTFARRRNLQKHFLTHRANTTVCIICNTPFHSSKSYAEHQKCCGKLSSTPTEAGGDVEQSAPDLVCVKEETEVLFDIDLPEVEAKPETPSAFDSFTQDDQDTVTETSNETVDSDSTALVNEITHNFKSIIARIGTDHLMQFAEKNNDDGPNGESEVERAVNSITLQAQRNSESEQGTEMVTSTT